MPTVLSKPCKFAHMCLVQDDILHSLLLNCKPTMRLCKLFTKHTCNRLSYEVLRMHQNFYENCRLVLDQEKSRALADFFFKGSFPKKPALQILCQYYGLMYDKIKC